jgi:hypothetical protein
MTNTLSTSISTGITLTNGGNDQSPFTITSTGTVAPTAYGAIGVYGSAASGLTLINQGVIDGGRGSVGIGVAGGAGGAGVDLSGASSFNNSGTITGGGGGQSVISPFTGASGPGGAGGVGVHLSGAGSFSNSGNITGGIGGVGSTNAAAGDGVYLSGGGLFTNSGTITGGSGPGGDSGAYLNGGTLLNGGVIDGAQGADAVTFGANASTLVVEHGASFVGNVVANATIADVLAIGGSAPVTISNIGSEYQNFRALAFDSGSSGIVSGTYTAMDSQSLTNIAGFAQGDTLVLDGFAATSDTYVSGTGLELSNGSSIITLDITGNFTTGDFNVIDPPANTTIALNSNACFAEGTRILTTHGEIPVEQLSAGDRVILHNGGIAPITWIGHRSLALTRHPNPEQVNPIRICAGALDNNVPCRDLVLSPDHALYLNGALIPAKSLLNGSTIRQEARQRITYFHVELAAHDVIYAEGTPAESYLETGNRPAFANGGGALTLHPDFAQKLREQTGRAPLAEFGPLVEKTRAQILARTNQNLTDDPALTLHTNQDGTVIISSRSAIPGQLNPDPRDQRILGVKIKSLRAGAKIINLDHPDLTAGWHTPEPDGRWTNGRAIIPAALAKDGPITIELAATTQYPAPQPKRQYA